MHHAPYERADVMLGGALYRLEYPYEWRIMDALGHPLLPNAPEPPPRSAPRKAWSAYQARVQKCQEERERVLVRTPKPAPLWATWAALEQELYDRWGSAIYTQEIPPKDIRDQHLKASGYAGTIRELTQNTRGHVKESYETQAEETQKVPSHHG